MVTKDTPAAAGTAGARTVAELLRVRAREQPERLGYTFLSDGETDEVALSYAGADRRARAVAASLRDAGCTPGTRVILLLPPGLEYVTAFYGCLYAGVVAVPVYPPDPVQLQRSLPRLLAIVRDAAPAIALTTSPLLAYLEQVAALAPRLGELRWLAVDAAPDPVDGAGVPAPAGPEAVAMIQYTSGSTAAPRGVLLSHGNLLHNLGLIQGFFGTSADTRAVVWLPPYHDMGLIGGLLQPLYAGCQVTLMSPLHFLEQPMRWLRAIDRIGATASGGPNFAYELCVRRADPDQIARLDLSSWRVAFNGAEPIRPETMERFARTFAPAGFRADAFLPCYGLAEATLIVSGAGGRRGSGAGAAGPPVVRVDRAALGRNVAAPPGDGPDVRLTACGHGAADQEIAIVDPATRTPCGPGRVGEIWVSGPSVAAGYWGRTEESDRVFRARVAGRDATPFLRTGDLGFLHDGRLVVTGRLKDLIIVRGQNHYPHDIEVTAERADPVLRTGCSAAFQVPADGVDDDLVLVHEVRRAPEPGDVAGVANRVRQAVAREHGLRVHTVTLIRAGGLPKTSSGKVQRRLCRARLLSGELPEVGRHVAAPPASGDAPADAGPVAGAPPAGRAGSLESYLRGQIAALVGADPAGLDPREPLLAAGLDSLAVVQLKHRLETDLGVDLPLAALLAGASLAEVVDLLAGPLAAPPARRPEPAAPGGAGHDPAAERVAPMAHGQRWIWLMQLIEPESTVHTVAVALRLLGAVDRPALRRALDTVVARHPVLRTTFTVRGGEPVQVVHPHGRAGYREHDLPDPDGPALARRLADAARRPFDLGSGPLLRADLYRHPGGEVLLLAMHHIVTDFWSCTILAREVAALYTAYAAGREATLPAPRATFLDVADWRRSLLADPARAGRLERYWADQLGDGVPRLALAVDGDRRSAGGVRSFSLPAPLTDRLRARAAAERVTPYVLLLAGFQALLHRLTGQPDLAVGAAVAGRTRPEFADVVGCCTSSVMIRSRATGGEPFRDLLSRTRDRVIGALEHQDYPMTVLAERHRPDHRGSLVDALFAFNRSPRHGDDLAAVAMLGPPGVRRRLGPLEVQTVPLPAGPGALPLELVMAEACGAVYGQLRHRAGILDERAAERLVEQLVMVLERVAADPGVPLGDLLPAVPAGSRDG